MGEGRDLVSLSLATLSMEVSVSSSSPFVSSVGDCMSLSDGGAFSVGEGRDLVSLSLATLDSGLSMELSVSSSSPFVSSVGDCVSLSNGGAFSVGEGRDLVSLSLATLDSGLSLEFSCPSSSSLVSSVVSLSVEEALSVEEGRDLVLSLATLDSSLSLELDEVLSVSNCPSSSSFVSSVGEWVYLSVGESLTVGEDRDLESSLTTLDSSLFLRCKEKVVPVTSVLL